MEKSNQSLKVVIVTPHRALGEENCEYLSIPTENGIVGILPGHASLITLLSIGELALHSNGKIKRYFICNGYMEVVNNKVMVLTDSGECQSDISLERAKKARDRAIERMSKSSSDVDLMRVKAALDRANTRIFIASKSS